jgi:creatinine amidohydrolase
MSARPYLLAETTWATVRDTDYDLAVLPWGATEAHNYHLPYATDTIQCDHVAAAAAEQAWADGTQVLVLPTVPFGVNTGHLDIPGVVNMHPSTQAAVLEDVAESLVAQGFRKLLVLNGHGGNTFKPLVREVQAAVDELFIGVAHWFEIGDWADYFDDLGDHAGEMETSVMLNAAPELVRPLEEAGEGTARVFSVDALRSDWAWAERQWTDVTEDTGVGTPEAATVEKGRSYLDEVTARLAGLFGELGNADLDALYMDAPDA